MSLTPTLLNEFTLAYERSNLDVHEHRLSRYGAYETFLRDTPNLIPGWQEFVEGRSTESRTARIPVIKRATYSTASARSCTAETKENTSAFVTPSWTTIKTGFQMVPSQYVGNYIKEQADFNRKMEDVQRTFLAVLDLGAYTHLNANKSQVNNADGNPYTVVANAMAVPEADNNLFFNELGAIMESNDVGGLQNVVGSTRLEALVRQYSSQGTSNAENRVFQFGDYSFAYSNRVAVSTGDRDTVFSMPIGTLAYLPWIDPDARARHESGDGKEWMPVSLPLLGHSVGLLVQSTCADKSSLASGLEATLVKSFQFSFDYSFVSSYNSDAATLPGSIFRANFSKT